MGGTHFYADTVNTLRDNTQRKVNEANTTGYYRSNQSTFVGNPVVFNNTIISSSFVEKQSNNTEFGFTRAGTYSINFDCTYNINNTSGIQLITFLRKNSTEISESRSLEYIPSGTPLETSARIVYILNVSESDVNTSKYDIFAADDDGKITVGRTTGDGSSLSIVFLK